MTLRFRRNKSTLNTEARRAAEGVATEADRMTALADAIEVAARNNDRALRDQLTLRLCDAALELAKRTREYRAARYGTNELRLVGASLVDSDLDEGSRW